MGGTKVRWTFAVFVSVALAAAIAGCSSSPAATPTPGATLPPGVTQPPGGGTQPPTATAPPVGTPADVCAGMPTFSADAPMPSLAQDTALIAKFPTQVDGQPVTNISSSFWLQSMCFYGGSAGDLARFAALWPAGTAGQISSGSGQVELNGETVHIQALRIPGSDPNVIFSHLTEFVVALGGDPADVAGSSVTTANVGGKNAYVLTDSDGDVSYHLVSGDTVFTVDVSQEAAAAIFAAIP
jgi:hypothetical protein